MSAFLSDAMRGRGGGFSIPVARGPTRGGCAGAGRGGKGSKGAGSCGPPAEHPAETAEDPSALLDRSSEVAASSAGMQPASGSRGRGVGDIRRPGQTTRPYYKRQRTAGNDCMGDAFKRPAEVDRDDDDLQCGRCGVFASSEVEWNTVPNADGEVVRVGTCCARCWRGWLHGWSEMWPVWVTFCVKCHEDASVNDAFEKSLDIQQRMILPGVDPKGSCTKVASGYTIKHNYSIVDQATWESIAAPGVTPQLCTRAEHELRDLRTGSVYKGVFRQAEHKPFCEIEAFTTHWHETVTEHASTSDVRRAEQGYNSPLAITLDSLGHRARS